MATKTSIAGTMNATVQDGGLGTSATYRVVARINPNPPAGDVAAPNAGVTVTFTGKFELTA